jgi:hypothetical protein
VRNCRGVLLECLPIVPVTGRSGLWASDWCKEDEEVCRTLRGAAVGYPAQLAKTVGVDLCLT